MSLEITNLTLHAGEFSLSNISLTIPEGECAVLMGKSGAGKTTLMEGLCGLRQLKGGSILLDGTDITHLRPGERGIGLVPQDTV
ncbi:MAG: ATP-binding cassette domain-containing protein, partial [Akkermansiaceae bacterium]